MTPNLPCRMLPEGGWGRLFPTTLIINYLLITAAIKLILAETCCCRLCLNWCPKMVLSKSLTEP